MPSVEEQLAWVAGIFEGEGWFTLQKRSQKVPYPTAVISMVDQDVVQRFREIVGMGAVFPVNKGAGHQRQWRCVISGRHRVERFVQLVEPWLGERRLEQAQRVLDESEPQLLTIRLAKEG